MRNSSGAVPSQLCESATASVPVFAEVNMIAREVVPQPTTQPSAFIPERLVLVHVYGSVATPLPTVIRVTPRALTRTAWMPAHVHAEPFAVRGIPIARDDTPSPPSRLADPQYLRADPRSHLLAVDRDQTRAVGGGRSGVVVVPVSLEQHDPIGIDELLERTERVAAALPIDANVVLLLELLARSDHCRTVSLVPGLPRQSRPLDATVNCEGPTNRQHVITEAPKLENSRLHVQTVIAALLPAACRSRCCFSPFAPTDLHSCLQLESGPASRRYTIEPAAQPSMRRSSVLAERVRSRPVRNKRLRRPAACPFGQGFATTSSAGGVEAMRA
jgi:hypothetical protein